MRKSKQGRHDTPKIGPDGDLLGMVQRGVEIFWVNSQLSKEEAIGKGFEELLWAGNELVDKAAGDAAQEMIPGRAAKDWKVFVQGLSLIGCFLIRQSRSS